MKYILPKSYIAVDGISLTVRSPLSAELFPSLYCLFAKALADHMFTAASQCTCFHEVAIPFARIPFPRAVSKKSLAACRIPEPNREAMVNLDYFSGSCKPCSEPR